MIVSSEQRFCSEKLFVRNVFENRSCNAHTVKGGCASAYFVKYEKTVFCGVFEDIRHLVHFYHEGRLSCGKVVRCSYSCEYAVDYAYLRRLRRNIGTHLCHKDYKCRLTHECGFTRHIRAGDYRNTVLVGIKKCVIGDKALIIKYALNYRMTALFKTYDAAVVDYRTDIVIVKCHLSK